MSLRIVATHIPGILPSIAVKSTMSLTITQNCAPHHVKVVEELIDTVISSETVFAKSSRNRRRLPNHSSSAADLGCSPSRLGSFAMSARSSAIRAPSSASSLPGFRRVIQSFNIRIMFIKC